LSTTRRDFEVRGGRLAGYQLCDGDGPPVLAVPGITSTSRNWVAVARRLGDQVRLVALDLRGRGASAELPPPFGLDSHVEDLLAVMDSLGWERVVLLGHSMGAYIVSRLGARHPDRTAAVALVDGGLDVGPPPGSEPVDLDVALGPALARLRMRFPSRSAYLEWWRQHPAIAGQDIADPDLEAYASHDLVGIEPELRSSVSEAAVRADGADIMTAGGPADELTVPAKLLVAPRGLLDEPRPFQPPELVRRWAAGSPDQREAIEVPDTNHYTLALGARGAAAVADAVLGLAADTSPPAGQPLARD